MMHRTLRFNLGWEWHMFHKQRPDTAGLAPRGGGKTAASAPSAAKQPADEGGAQAASAETAARQSVSGTIAGTAESPDQLRADGNVAEAVGEMLRWKRDLPELAAWIEETQERTGNHVAVSELPGGEAVLYGTLLFQASEDQDDTVPLHFWMTNGKLATVLHDMRLTVRMQLDPWEEKLQRCRTAPEGFFVVIGYMLETLHAGLDAFETLLGHLEEKMRRGNRTGLMNVIFERRYDLLHWNHLFLPIREIQGAAKEAFMDELTGLEEFVRIGFKLERIEELLAHYALEIDTLLAMDNTIAGFRGNDIMKALTIFTALFTPATVIGGIWGMNFGRIPWAAEPWGFAAISLIIIASTALIYWWLWWKGWTGDLLRGRKPHEFVAPASDRQQLELQLADRPPLPPRSASAHAKSEPAAQEDASLSRRRSRGRR